MKISVPAEVKNNEYRVAITPAGVKELTFHGHSVAVQAGAGRGASIADDDYRAAGATIVDSAAEAWSGEMVLKVKEPIASEYELMQDGQTLFTYLHLAANAELTQELLKRNITAIAYETVQLADRSLPLLAPMSEVAGRLSAQVGAHALMAPHGGRGVLMGGVPGVAPARVTVLGGGVAGLNAARVCAGMGADVTILDVNVPRLRYIDEVTGGRVRTAVSNEHAVTEHVTASDLVIGSVLIPGAAAPKLVSNELVSKMKAGAVLVDIAIDQGGCFEDSKPTTHENPTLTVHGTVFYCVANMPGGVANTSTNALSNVTLPYTVALADKGWEQALRDDDALALGLNTVRGKLTNAAVGEATGIPATSVSEILA